MTGGRAHILQLIGSSGLGGGFPVIRAVSRGLIEAGYRVSVLASDPRTLEAFAAAGLATIVCHHFGRPIRPLRDLRAVAETVAVCRRHEVDLLHTHTSKGGAVGRVASRWLGLPVVHTVHGYPFHEFCRPVQRAVFRLVERALAPMATRLVFISKDDFRYALARRWCRAARCWYIPNGVPIPPLPQPVPDHGGRPLLITVGRLSLQKGYPVLLRAFARLLADYPEARLWFVGDGEQRRELERLAQEMALLSSVEFLGFQEQPLEWLARAHLAVSPSLWEGLPIAVLEMMSARRPIVATSCRGTRDLLRDGVDAVLAPPGDAPALAEAMRAVLADWARARAMADNARERVESLYSEKLMVSRYLRLFDELTSSKG